MAIQQNILLSTDTLVFAPGPSILLVQRKHGPFQGKWAFPGGFLEDDEDLPEGAARELEEETGLVLEPEDLEQYRAVGTPGRDPRGRTVTVVFIAHLDQEVQVKGADDAADARWFPLEDLPEMAFDHREIFDSFARENGNLT